MADAQIGLLDTTGELMKYAISHLLTKDGMRITAIAYEICDFLRNMQTQFHGIVLPANSPFSKEFGNKMKTMAASVSKVENAIYLHVVRANEFKD